MPRPANGYTNAADQPVPGVHDITKRYADKGGLIHWAHQEGLKGNRDLYARAADIGTAVHRMAELDLRGEPEREVNAVPYGLLHQPADIDKAIQSFRQYRAWRKEHDVRAIAFEEAIVSERFQYGGTFDVIAWVDGVRSLIDFKTCKTAGAVYLEMRLAMAAHSNLWHERHPDLPLQAYHLITLPKDGSRFGHHAFANLSPEFEMFTLQLDCWRIEKSLTRKRTTKPATVMPAPKAVLTAEAPAPTAAIKAAVVNTPAAKPRRTRKPKAAAPVAPVVAVTPAVVAPPLSSLSLAEILRANGFVPPLEEAIRC